MDEDLETLRLRAMAKSKAAQGREAEHEDNRSVGAKALDYGLRFVGTPGGVARAGTAEVINSFLPEGQDITRPDDLKRVMRGQAPTTSEYLERAGVPSGPKLSDIFPAGYAEHGRGAALQAEKGGALDPSLRGAAGLVGDIVTDPLTYLSAGLSRLSKAGELKTPTEEALHQALNPVEAAAGRSAKANYEKAFNYVDKKFPDKAQSTAEILRQHGFVGGANEAAEKLAEINANAGQKIGATLNTAAEQGATVAVPDALEQAWFKAEQLKTHGTPEADKLAADIQSRIQQLYDTHPNGIPANQANQIKSDLNNYINFNPTAQEAIGNKARKSVAGGLSQGIDASVGATDPEVLKQLLEQKALYSSTSPQVQQRMTQFGNQVAQQSGPLGFTAVDAMLAGGGALGGAAAHTGVGFIPLAGKKLVNAAQSTTGRTLRGAVADKIYKSSLPKDAALRNIWEEMNNKGDEQ